MSELSQLAKKYYENGCSCSESIIKSAAELGMLKSYKECEILDIASMFSGGMFSGCLCGAAAGSQIVLGCVFGQDAEIKRTVAKNFIKSFKEKRKATCCASLSAPYKNNPVEHRKNCATIVEESAQILENIINSYSNQNPSQL